MAGSVATTNRDIARVVGAASSHSPGPWVGDAALRPAIPCKLQNTGSRLPRTFVSSPVQQATDRLATVPAGASQLVYQITFGPRRLTPGIPVRQQREGLMIREHETTHQATTHAECVDVAVLAGDRRWQQRQVSLMNIRDRLFGKPLLENTPQRISASGKRGRNDGLCVVDKGIGRVPRVPGRQNRRAWMDDQ